MTFKLPKSIAGRDAKKDYETVMAREDAKPIASQTDPNLNGFIYVPSIKLYVAKEKTHLGKSWFETHKALISEGLRMPTIKEFIEYLKYTKTNFADIYNEITEKKGPWRGEWLDADFNVKDELLYINYNHVLDSKGNLIPKNSEHLENCLMEDCYADVLGSANKQGLPVSKANSGIYYCYPRSDNNSVAWFLAYSGGAGLGCGGGPSLMDSSLGVRAVRETGGKNDKARKLSL